MDMNELMQEYRKKLERTIRDAVELEMGWSTAGATQMLEVPDVLTPEELQSIQLKQSQWAALCEEGLHHGWLEWTNDYEGSHLEVVISEYHPTRTRTVPETKEQRRDRLNALGKVLDREVSTRLHTAWKELGKQWSA